MELHRTCQEEALVILIHKVVLVPSNEHGYCSTCENWLSIFFPANIGTSDNVVRVISRRTYPVLIVHIRALTSRHQLQIIFADLLLNFCVRASHGEKWLVIVSDYKP